MRSTDYTFANGTVGKIVTYHMEERERVKIVDYPTGSEDSIQALRRSTRSCVKRTIELRLDSFLDDGTIRRVEGVLREMMAEKGFTNAEVSHRVTPVAGGPKLVNVTFDGRRGTRSSKIRDVEFVGNTAISDGKLEKQIKENKPKNPLYGWISGGGTYKEDEVRRGRREGRRVLPEQRLSAGACRAARGQDARENQGRQDGVDSVADPRDRG